MEARSPGKIIEVLLKIEHPVRACLATTAIFSNGSIIPPGFKFMKLHALTQAARSYALLLSLLDKFFKVGVIVSTFDICL